MSDIPGLPRRSKKCKICNSFSDKHLAEITAAMINGTMTYHEIMEKYNSLRKEGTRPINPANCTAHKKHSSPKDLLDRALKKFNEDPESVARSELERSILQKKGDQLDKGRALEAMYSERIQSLVAAQDILTKTRLEYANEPENSLRKRKLARDVINLTKEVEKISKSISSDLLSHEKLEKPEGMGSGNVFIFNTYESSLKMFMDRVIDILYDQVPGKERARDIARRIGMALDETMEKARDEVEDPMEGIEEAEVVG